MVGTEAHQRPMTDPQGNPDFPVYRRDADSPAGWHRRDMVTLWDSPFLRVEQVTYQTPTHTDGKLVWTVVRRKNAVIIAPRLPDGRFILIHQERYPIQRTLWEFPAGQIDQIASSDDPVVIAATAIRELAEETGHVLDPDHGQLVPLGYYFSSQGFTDEHAYLFLADGVLASGDSPHGSLGEGDEVIHEARAFTAAELEEMIARNEIVDANTLATYARLKARGLF